YEWPELVLKEAFGEGGAQDYLHEAAQADEPPSGVFYDPDGDGVGLPSLGVHEHWHNPGDKQNSRNRGYDFGIELVQVKLDEPEPDPEPSMRLAFLEDSARMLTWGLDPTSDYVLETVDPQSGETTELHALPKGTYGHRVDIPF